jgi:NitT/TauT family transport system substrate-binding protein
MSSIMTTDQICQAFGISKSTLNNWRKEKGLPFIKVGRTVRYDYQAVIDWLKKHEVSGRKER